MCEGIMKIFVETGPSFDHCGEHRKIEVDLKTPGQSLYTKPAFPPLQASSLRKLGTFPEENRESDWRWINTGIAGNPADLTTALAEITTSALNLDDSNVDSAKPFPVLDLVHALNVKLHVLYERRFARDFQDVQWFLDRYPDEIRDCVDKLDEDGLAAFIASLPPATTTTTAGGDGAGTGGEGNRSESDETTKDRRYWSRFFGLSEAAIASVGEQEKRWEKPREWKRRRKRDRSFVATGKE
jgi:hypothetical protein